MSGRKTGARVIALIALIAIAPATTAPAATDPQGTAGMTMVGNMSPYPDLDLAGPANVRRARRLVHETLAAAPRFDTIAKAQHLGYVPGPPTPRRPGFTHMRKHGFRFTGRLFDPQAPQALVFWCPAQGRCVLANFMYRAPAGPPPGTWGDIIQWHRHGMTPSATWMTHLWLTRHTRDAFATCAPMPALAWRGIEDAGQGYTPSTTELAPCPDTPPIPM